MTITENADTLLADQEGVCVEVVAGARFELRAQQALDFEFLVNYRGGPIDLVNKNPARLSPWATVSQSIGR